MTERTFRGGVHPDDGKAYSRDAALTVYEPKGELVFPVSQHIGKPAKVAVSVGDKVLAGQVLAEQDGYVSSRIHSSCSGTVKAIEKRRTVMGGLAECVVVENDGKFRAVKGMGTKTDFRNLSREEILQKIRDAGIVGMGGASFPTPVKLEPKNPDGIEYVIVNGAECEPFITCDDQLMRTHAGEIVTGLKVMLSLFPQARGVILIEENKPEAIEAMTEAVSMEKNIRVQPAPTKYPQGGEKSIIKVVAGKDTKMSQLPAEAGCIVDNVSTVYAIYEAVCRATPLIRRAVTVTGPAVKNPGNFIVRVGTSFRELLDAAGGLADGAEIRKAIAGGAMMGIAMPDLDVPVQKASNALTLLTVDGVEEADKKLTPCIRCGRCNEVCPMGLTPQMMGVAAERKEYGKYENRLYGLECISCGSCTYICPAKRPLMQLFKDAKGAILEARRMAQQGGGAK
ncbi:MAG: electron transport complex subunit RsxC [Oscillibacter sp.]|nr:electron transport complex subunit RsxC [Oscillibacter sp.]